MRVLEFAQVAAGPYAGALLADMGADVVKVEAPRGDDLRRWPPLVRLPDDEEFSLNFASLNRSKRSVVLDLKHAAGLQTARKLVENADVVLENFRPGVMARLGLGFEAVGAINPHIIFCSISGYGQTGPDSQRGAFDVVVQAEAGLMDVTGAEGGEPAKCGVPVADFVTGQYAAFAILCAYIRRMRQPEPVYIDCSMLESVLAVSALQTSEYWGTGRPPRRLGTAHPRNAPYQAFHASDGIFVIAAGNDRLWQQTCAVVGEPALADHPSFRTQSLRVANMHALATRLETVFGREPLNHWLELFRRHGVPCAPVNDYAAALAHEQLAHRRFVRPLDLPGGLETCTTVLPLTINGINTFGLRPPPRLGEHTDEVIEEWIRCALPRPESATAMATRGSDDVEEF